MLERLGGSHNRCTDNEGEVGGPGGRSITSGETQKLSEKADLTVLRETSPRSAVDQAHTVAGEQTSEADCGKKMKQSKWEDGAGGPGPQPLWEEPSESETEETRKSSVSMR